MKVLKEHITQKGHLIENGKLLPSMAHGIAVRPHIQGAIEGVVTGFFNSNSMSPEAAVNTLPQKINKVRKAKKNL